MTSSITVEPYETVEFPDSDTDSWQVVDPFDSDNDDVITTESDVVSSSDEGEDVDEEDEDEDVDIDDIIASESDVISSDEDEDDEDVDDVITSEEEEEEEEEEDDVITSEDEEDDVDEITNHTQELNKGYESDGLINGEGGAPYNVEISDVMKEDAYFEHMQLQQRMLEEDDVEEDEDEDEYDEDLDDELVPRWLNNKFERQRMRKLGKKVYPKMKKSKRMVNQYNRPGCAGAKHGLGLNNNLVW